MRKKAAIPAIFIAAILISIAVTFIIAGSFKQNGLLFSGKMTDLTQGWRTPGGAEVSLPGSLHTDQDGFVTLHTTLPESLPGGSVLLLKTSYKSLDVFVDGQNIYSWNGIDKAPFVRSFSLPVYLVHLPDSSAGNSVELRLSSGSPGTDVTVYSAAVGDGVSAAVSLIGGSFVTILLFFILAVIFILLLACLLLFRKRITRQNLSGTLYLSALIALSAVWILSDSDLHLLFTPNVTATLYCALFSLMLLPVPLLLFAGRFVERGRKVANVLAGLVLLNFFICLGLMLTGTADLIGLLVTSHILDLISCAAVIVLSLIELLRGRRRDLMEVFLGLILLSLFSASSVIVFSLSGNPRSTSISHAGLTVFLLMLGFGMARRGIADIAGSKSYTEMTMSIPSGICRIENFDTGRIVYANEFYYNMFGYTEAEARCAGFTSAYFSVLPEDLDAMKNKIKKYFTVNLSRFETESRHVKKDGEVVWILARYKMARNTYGAITLVMIDITDRKQMEENIRISEEEYRIATLHSNKYILRLDIKMKTAYQQSDNPPVFGVPSVMENVPESFLSAGMVAQDSIDVFRGFFDAIYKGDREGNAVVSIYDRSDGEFKWYHFDFTTIFSDTGKPAQAIITFYDVTLQRQKELAFQRWQQSYNAIPKSATNYYEYNLTDDKFEHEEGGMIPVVPAGVSRTLSGVASYIAEFHIFEEDVAGWLAFMSRDRLLERYSAGQHTDKMEFRRQKSGEPKWTSVSIQLIPDPYSSDVKGYFLLEDIDEQKQAVIDLQERSTLDSLTGLLNRAAFIEKFNDILLNTDLETQHALIMLDIDNFKTINDTLGHNAGDALLINIASKLKYALRSDDLCGRLGGDEFVICLKSMNHGKPLETRVSDLCGMVSHEHNWGVSVSASFGIASFPSDGLTFEELYKKADIALYKAKAQGRGCYAVYDPQLSFDDITPAKRA